MSLLESMLIIGGISLDIFAAMEIQGAMLPQVKKINLAKFCLIVSILQLGFFLIGFTVCYLLSEHGIISQPEYYGQFLAVGVFVLLGARLMAKAIRREFVHERRKDSITVKEILNYILLTCSYTLAIGCVFGLVGVIVWQVLLIIVIITVLVVITGLYSGLHYGFQNKTIVYAVGAVLLWIAGVEILLHEILMIL
ncbi:MAG: manganese efflux pump [Pseudobutyrivibrio sp.]|nr:manganese efflux pump [Pseudobutyrivibrio sp.]